METRFEFIDFAKVFGLSLILYSLFVGLFQFMPGAVEFIEGLHPTASFLIQYIIQFVILFLPLWIFVVDKYDTALIDFGFRKVSIKKLFLTVILSYIFYLVVSYLITIFLFTSQLQVPGYEAQESYIPLFGTDALGYTTAIIFIVIVAPFLEELFFRGFVYRIFTKTWPVWFGSIMTALLFALIHFQINSFIPLFILALILNYTYHRTKSVWTSMAFHSLNNTIAFSLDIYLYYHPELLQELEMVTALLYN